MRTRLFLSAAVATLSLCLSQGYAQNARHEETGGEAAKQGESAQAKKPGEQGAAARHEEQRAQEQNRQHNAREAEKENRTGAAKQENEKRGEATRDEKQGAATKGEEKHGAAATKAEEKRAKQAEEKRGAAAKKDEKRGALDEEKSRTPTAQGGREANRPDEADRNARERMGRSATENERRATQTEERAGQRERRGEMEQGQEQNRGAFDRATRGEGGRGAYGFGGREAQEGRELRGGREAQEGREARGGRDQQLGRQTGREGGRVQLSQQDQTRVRQIISQQQNVQRISPNVFSPRIGAVVPPSVQFYPLPPAVISMYPQFDGFNYVMVGDDIAIIDPGDREVVTVLGEGGVGGVYGYGYGDEEREGFQGGYEGREGRYEGREGRFEGRQGRFEGRSAQREDRYRGGGERRGEAYGYAPRVRLDNRQERTLYRGVMNEARSNLRQVCVRVGDRVPQSVDLEPVPRAISAEVPDVERFEYFVLNDQVVLVDPDTRVVVDMIQEPR